MIWVGLSDFFSYVWIIGLNNMDDFDIHWAINYSFMSANDDDPIAVVKPTLQRKK